MDETVNRGADESGLNIESARKALGAVLTFLKEKLGGDFSKLPAALPGGDAVMKAFEGAKEESGGVMSALTGTLSRAFGGERGDLFKMLAKFNIDPAQLAKFLPAVIAPLKEKPPPDPCAEVEALMPKLPSA